MELIEMERKNTLRENEPRTDFRYRLISKYIKRGKVLDLGCGHAYLRDYLAPEVEYYGVDFVQREGDDFKNFFEVDITKESLPFEDNVFGFVVASETLEHLSNFYQTMMEIHRVLIPGGILIVTVPNHSKLYWSIRAIRWNNYHQLYVKDGYSGSTHIHALDEPTLRNLFFLTGFKPIHFDRFYNATYHHKLPEWRIFTPFALHILGIAKKEVP